MEEYLFSFKQRSNVGNGRDRSALKNVTKTKKPERSWRKAPFPTIEKLLVPASPVYELGKNIIEIENEF